MNRRFSKFFVISAVAALPSLGLAQTPEPLPEVVVTAQALEDLQTERIQSPVPAVAVGRDEMLERPYLRLGDSLKFTPGIYFGGDPNENQDLQLRGMPVDYSRVQIGGVQIPDAGGEAREFQLNRLPSGLFKKAKEIRNPTAEYESDGIGGRLELETVSIPEKFSGEFRLGYGARDQENPLWNLSALGGGRVNEWFGLLGAADYGLDPSLKYKNVDNYESGVLVKSSHQEEHKELESYGAFVDAGFFYGDGELHIKPMYLRLDSDKRSQKASVDFTKAASKDQSLDQDYERKQQETAGFTASSLHRWSDAARQETLLSYYQATENTPRSGTDSYKESGGALAFDEQELERWRKEDSTADFQTKTTLDLSTALKQQVKFGAAARWQQRDSRAHRQLMDDAGDIDDLTDDSDDYHLTEDYFATFAQDQIWLTDKLSVLPGLRMEYMRLRSHDGGSDRASRSMTDWNPTLHTLYQPAQDLAFHLSFSRTVNRPQFDQLSPYRRVDDDEETVTVGNPGLDPARSWNLDLGVDWKTAPLFLSANVFYKKITDVIQQDRVGSTLVGGNDYDLYESRNVGDGWMKGVELEQRYDIGKSGVTLWANESVYSSRLRYESGQTSPFEEQPEFIANLGVDYVFARTGTRLSLAGNFVDSFEWEESDGTRISYAPEWVVNFSLRQPIARGLEAFLEVTNLTDEERLETEKKPGDEMRHEHIRSGRTLLAGLNYRF